MEYRFKITGIENKKDTMLKVPQKGKHIFVIFEDCVPGIGNELMEMLEEWYPTCQITIISPKE